MNRSRNFQRQHNISNLFWKIYSVKKKKKQPQFVAGSCTG